VPSLKAKRRINPTLVKPNSKSMSFSIQDGGSVKCSSFSRSNLHSAPNLDQALREDREEIQKEIALRRKKLVVKNAAIGGISGGSRRNEQHGLGTEFGCSEAEGHRNHDKPKSGFSGEHQQAMVVGALQFEPTLDVISKEEFVRGLANQDALIELSVLYTRVIKGW